MLANLVTLDRGISGGAAVIYVMNISFLISRSLFQWNILNDQKKKICAALISTSSESVQAEENVSKKRFFYAFLFLSKSVGSIVFL